MKPLGQTEWAWASRDADPLKVYIVSTTDLDGDGGREIKSVWLDSEAAYAEVEQHRGERLVWTVREWRVKTRAN